MKIAIVGGTGTLGRQVSAKLRGRGHDVHVLSRNGMHRIDLITGKGLRQALQGCQVVVDASNDNSKTAEETLVNGSRRLLAAEASVGVRHHVCVSVVGCDQVPVSYFQTKKRQEGVVQDGPVGWTIVRATQFHELVGKLFAAGARWRVLPLPRARLQSVACAEVADLVADVAEGAPRKGHVEMAGPAVEDLRTLARIWKASTGRRVLLAPLPLPGKLGKILRDGALTATRPDWKGTITFAQWLETAAIYPIPQTART